MIIIMMTMTIMMILAMLMLMVTIHVTHKARPGAVPCSNDAFDFHT